MGLIKSRTDDQLDEFILKLHDDYRLTLVNHLRRLCKYEAKYDLTYDQLDKLHKQKDLIFACIQQDLEEMMNLTLEPGDAL